MKYTPTTDGFDHINIYSKAKTSLGRLLSNFAHTPFKHPKHGSFQSIEGFWYWLSTGQEHGCLRVLWGPDAKREGRKHTILEIPDFYEQIHEALVCKIAQHKSLRHLLYLSELPFTHYYYYGDDHHAKVINTEGGDWLTQQYDLIRDQEKRKGFRLIIAGSRSITDHELVRKAYLDSGFAATEIVSGKAKGVDTIGEWLAEEIGASIAEFPAIWYPDKHTLDRGAGHRRNRQMGDYAHGLLAVHDGASRGTQGMIDYASKLGMPMWVVTTHNLVPLEIDRTLGHCSECGASPDQMCSIVDPDHDDRGIELSNQIHSVRS